MALMVPAHAGLDPHWWDNNEIYGAVLLETYFVKRWATTPVNLPNSRYFTSLEIS